MAKYQFLTPEWVAAAKAIREEFEGESPAPAHSVRMNQIITEVPFGDTDVKAFMDTSDGALNLDQIVIRPRDQASASRFNRRT